MAHDFKLPDVGEGIEEAEVLKWMVDVGDRVREDDPIAEVETDKAIIEVPSPVSGRVKRFHAREGETVEIGETLVTFDDENGGNGGAREERNSGVEILDSDGNAAVDVDADGGDDEKRMENDGGKPSTAATRRLAREIGVDLEDVEGSGENGRVLPQDILHAAKEKQDDRKESRETDGNGDDSGDGEEDGDADGPGTAVPGKGEKAPAMEDDDATPEFGQGETPAVEPNTAEETTMFGNETPVAERTDEEATEEPEDATETRSERAGGLETRSEGIFEESTAVEEETEVSNEREDEGENGGDDEGHEETEQTVETETTTDQENGPEERERPLMTHHDVADAERLVEVRDAMDDSVEVSLTYTPLLVKACSEALLDNEVFVGDGGSSEIKVGVAVETGDGVAVPVIENADEKGVAEIAEEVAEAVGDARSGDVDETGEASFTLVNVGAIGGDGVSPVVDKPGVAAVSVGEIRQRPSVVDEEVVARHTAPLHITFDGDVADIAEAARFTNDLKRYVSEPAVMLL